MSISGVNGIGATAYTYMNSSMKTTGEGNFASEVQMGRGKMERNVAFAMATVALLRQREVLCFR